MKNGCIVCIVSAVLVCLSACGGGGNSGGGSGDDMLLDPRDGRFQANNYCQFRNPATVPASFRTQEYYESFGLSQIKAAEAYERTGAEGCGVTIAVIDEGLYVRDAAGNVRIHSELEDKVLPKERDHAFHQTDPAEEFPLNLPQLAAVDDSSHATWVATIAAGKRDSRGTHGIAPGASVLSHAIPLGEATFFYERISISDLSMATPFDAVVFSEVLSAGADVINASFAYPGVTDTYNTNEMIEATRPLWEVLAQPDRAAADRTVIVFGTGNFNNALSLDPFGFVDATSPSILAGLPYHVPELRGHVLAVAAVGTDGTITTFSNRCGVAKAFCLVAPGVAGHVETVDTESYVQQIAGLNGRGEETFTETARGTSFSAPLVSGAFAVLKSAFPTMGHHELVTRLLMTADKTGVYADTDIYGQGLLDLDAAYPSGRHDDVALRRQRIQCSGLCGGRGLHVAAGLRRCPERSVRSDR